MKGDSLVCVFFLIIPISVAFCVTSLSIMRKVKSGGLTLNVPASPDGIVNTNFIPPQQPQTLKRLPLRWDDLTTATEGKKTLKNILFVESIIFSSWLVAQTSDKILFGGKMTQWKNSVATSVRNLSWFWLIVSNQLVHQCTADVLHFPPVSLIPLSAERRPHNVRCLGSC